MAFLALLQGIRTRSKQTANVDDSVTIAGTVNRDFGSRCFYPLIIEEASVAPKK